MYAWNAKSKSHIMQKEPNDIQRILYSTTNYPPSTIFPNDNHKTLYSTTHLIYIPDNMCKVLYSTLLKSCTVRILEFLQTLWLSNFSNILTGGESSEKKMFSGMKLRRSCPDWREVEVSPVYDDKLHNPEQYWCCSQRNSKGKIIHQIGCSCHNNLLSLSGWYINSLVCFGCS